LHLVGYLYYWQMGFNSVFKWLTVPLDGGESSTSRFELITAGKERCCPQNMKLGGLQNRRKRFQGEKNLFPLHFCEYEYIGSSSSYIH